MNTPLRLLQLSDPHLFAAPTGQLLGITTRSSFASVLALALAQPAHAMIMTGDLVHDASPDGYAALHAALEATGLPCYCLAGNHDRRDLMETALGAAAVKPFEIQRLPFWDLVFLDSVICGLSRGHLPPEHLAQLDAWLSDSRVAALIFLHHHPVPVNSAWLDPIGVENGAALLHLCTRHPQVKGVIFGHVHQAFESFQGDCQILGAPSTCIQFKPDSMSFALDATPPGYRELVLYPEGQLSTRVVRLAHYPESAQLHSEGY